MYLIRFLDKKISKWEKNENLFLNYFMNKNQSPS